ncbi:hypothetical protein ACFLZ5_04005 [Thermodesulfobacteriota bacterium]
MTKNITLKDQEVTQWGIPLIDVFEGKAGEEKLQRGGSIAI